MDRFTTVSERKKIVLEIPETYFTQFWGPFLLRFGIFRIKRSAPEAKTSIFGKSSSRLHGSSIFEAPRPPTFGQNAPKTLPKRQKGGGEKRGEKKRRFPTRPGPKKKWTRKSEEILQSGGGTVERAAPFGYLARPCVLDGFSPWRLRKCCKVAHFRDVAISLIFASQ